MIILAVLSQNSMTSVVRLLIHPATWVCVLLAIAPCSSIIDYQEEELQRTELEQKIVPRYATSPGHTVFGEYVGAHWCGPCMSSASPSLDNLKTSNPEEFTFVSFFESSSGGWPSDGPVNRQTHIMQSSSGYPTFSFADSQSGSCYKVGASGTSYYDSDFSSGGCMSPSSNDFQLEMSMSLNSSTEEVTITLDSIYTGSLSTYDVYVYGAVTEKLGADSYDNGVKPHHNWRGWLLNSADTGFQQLSLSQGVWESHSWTAPLSTVRASGGYTQWENFWPVFALMDGPHSSYNEFLVAIDPDMGPMIDVGILEFEVQNTNGGKGFTPGDMLQISTRVSNNGVEEYSEGGDLGVYLISGSDEIYLGGQPIDTIGVAGSFLHQIDFDTSDIDPIPSGVSTFRAKLVDMGSDRNSTNNVVDNVEFHDMPPIPSPPAATGSTTFERGDSVQFETTALPNDLVDDINTMSPAMEYSKSGSGVWDSIWVSDPEIVGSGANAAYVHTIQTPPNAETGKYDTRVMWEDARGQQSDWLVTSQAFELSNALPRVLGNNDPGFIGTPTVKVGETESISLVGLVRDAETPLSMLSIDSNDPEFVGWNGPSSEITVLFDSIESDSNGNPVPQGLFLSISDGEDANNGMLMFNVIENGAPRWDPIPTQTVFEGGSASTELTGYLSDFDVNGDPVPPSEISISLVSNSNEDLIQVSLDGQTVTASTIDEDSHGVAEVIIMADDGSKTSQTSVVFYVINVNDAPEMDVSILDGLALKSGELASIGIMPLISDIDDPEDEIWVDVDTPIPGAVQFDYVSGVLNMQWDRSGTHSVKMTLIDSHGDWSSTTFTVTVLDSKPLTWHTDFQEGDLEVELEGFEIGIDPTVTLVNNGEVVIEDPKVRWTICNGIVGICHSAGSFDGLGPFQAVSSDGSGLSIGDYLTLSVKAVDSDGWDRETVEPLDILVPTTSEEDDVIGAPNQEEEKESNQQSGDGSSDISVMDAMLIILVLLIFIGGGTVAGLYFSGAIGNRREQAPKAPYSPDTPQEQPPGEEPVIDFEQHEEIYPPLPESGLPEGWTMDQWKYYGEQWLERQN